MRRIEWRQSSTALGSRDLIVWVDAKAADAAWSKDTRYYLSPGGGYNRRQYLEFGKALDHRKSKLDMVEAGIVDQKLVLFSGECVLRWMVDHSALAIPLSMQWPCANRAISMMGTGLQDCVVNQRSEHSAELRIPVDETWEGQLQIISVGKPVLCGIR